MKLLLFDIDGTLLRVTNGAQSAVTQAVATVTGESASTEGVSFAGRTDPAIFRDVLAESGISPREDLLTEVMRVYADIARKTIQSQNVKVLAGVTDLLSALATRPNVVLGLVTGNVEPIAFHKLRTAGVDEYFSFGAFGSDHENRSNLPAVARQRATATTGRAFALHETILIGDTEHDVQSAHSAGVRSIAVCTGRPSRTELASQNPDLLLETLQDTSGVLKAILEL